MTTSHLTSKHATLRGLLSAAPRRTPVVDATLVRSEMAKAIVSVVVQDFQRIAADHGRLVHAWERLALEDLQRLVWELENPRYQVHPAQWARLRARLADLADIERRNAKMLNARTPFENRYDDDDDRGETWEDMAELDYTVPAPRATRASQATDATVDTPLCPDCGSSSVVVSMMTVGVQQLDLKEAHCLICAWRVELGRKPSATADVESELELEEHEDGTLLEKIDESGNSGDDEQDIVPSSMTDEEETQCSAVEDFETQDMESAEDPVDQLMALQNRFWQDWTVKPLRCALLEGTMRERLSGERLDMVWAVASTLMESCRGLGRAEQQEIARWLMRTSTEELRAFLPESELAVELAQPEHMLVVPSVSMKIQKWQLACRLALRRFRVASAGVRILAPSFGVSPDVFRAASA